MATTSITASEAHAAQLISSQDRWATVRVKATGERLTVMPGSRGHVHQVTLDGCDCKSWEWRRSCAHVTALRAAQPAPAVEAPAPKARPTYEELFPACPCGDVADSKDGYCDRCAADREWQSRRVAS